MKLNVSFRLQKAWFGTRQKLVSSLNYVFCFGENLNLQKAENLALLSSQPRAPEKSLILNAELLLSSHTTHLSTLASFLHLALIGILKVR